ncbi:MAG: RNA methyltransferase [Tatlockia sp.]|nr:RNA methyltransferase [Tatlockia sp.]
MKFDAIRIVLVETSHPGNIGSTARAMKTMGLSKLYLVSPKSFPDQKAREMAAGADDVLNQAVLTNSLEEALQGCQLILATSARPRDLSLPGLTPSGSAQLIAEQTEGMEIAVVFGREHAGLTNEELLRCHYHVNIPSNPDFSSLNLGQAVQIIAYELRMKLLAPKAEVELRMDRLATAEEVEQFYSHLTEVLTAIKFLKPTNPTKRLQQRIRRLFNRARLENKELTILRGILSQVLYTLKSLDKGV